MKQTMDTLIGSIGLVTVAAITPGPNNLVVMRAAGRAGLHGAFPAIAGVVLGGLALLAVTAAGTGTLFESLPALRFVIAAAGSLYLVWLGAKLVAGSLRGTAAAGADTTLPAGLAGMAVFQFLNPKSWVLVLTAVSAAGAGGSTAAFAQLALVFVLIPFLCLLAWSLLGAAMTRYLARRRVRAWFDRAMGGALAGSAVLLLADF